MVDGPIPAGATSATVPMTTDPPTQPPQALVCEAPPLATSDSLSTSSATTQGQAAPVSLFADHTAATGLGMNGPTTTTPTITPPAKDPTNPWHLKSLNVRYGLIFSDQYAPSTIHITNPQSGTDMVLHDVHAHQRLSAQYLYSMPNGFPQPDEPQTEVGISGKFENNWGFEANLKHNKYVVNGDPGDGDQQVHITGHYNGAPIDETRPVGTVLPEYQITDGLNEISFMATRSFNLPHPQKDSFTYTLKAGPSVLMPFVKSTMINADGSETHQEGPYKFGAGWGAQVEESLRYDFRNQVSIELTHGLSYMDMTNGSAPGGGKASQTVLAQQFALTLGKTFNFRKHH